MEVTPCIALILPNLTLGGTERQAVELALRLPDYGWKPIVMVADDYGVQRSVLEDAGIPIFHLECEFWRGKISPRFWANLAGVIARMRSTCIQEQVSVVQSFLFWQNIFAVPAARLVPSVKGIITGRRNLGVFKDERKYYQFLENKANRYTDLVVCNDSDVALDVCDREDVKRSQIRVISNGVDADRFASAVPIDLRREYPKLADAKLILGTVGNLKKQKRHDIFLTVIARLRKKYSGVKGIIVGRNLGEEVELKRIRNNLDLDDAVVFTGRVKDVAPYYKAFDQFLFTSDFEGMPNAVMEAMAAGCPIVSTQVGGIQRLLQHGRQGRLVPPGEVYPLEMEVRWVMDHPEEAKAMAESAQERIKEKFSFDRMVSKYVELYSHLLEKDQVE